VHLTAGIISLPYLVLLGAYPTRPITIIVSFVAGGSGDTIARILAERMRASLGQPVIIENVSGASGSLGVGRSCLGLSMGNDIVADMKAAKHQRRVAIRECAAHVCRRRGGICRAPCGALAMNLGGKLARPSKRHAGLRQPRLRPCDAR
jgi:Tripartite tricarboxylate transporter family receptor